MTGRQRRVRRNAILSGFLAFPFSFPIMMIFNFFMLNSASGGALLSRVILRYPFRLLANAVHATDKRLCGAVVTGAAPCVFSANPDVAGVGVSRPSHLRLSTVTELVQFKGSSCFLRRSMYR